MKKITKSFAVVFGVSALALSIAGCSNENNSNTGISSGASQGNSSSSASTASIKVYTRDTTSGTREGFFEGIGFDDAKKDNSQLVGGYVEVSGNGTMVSSIKNDEYGIGYISLASLTSSELKGLTFENVAPTEENVVNGTYSLTRNFNYCIRETYSNTNVENVVKAFLAYMSTIEGQSTIADKGGIVETTSTTTWNSIKSNYPATSSDNSAVTINVGGSTSVESIVSALLLEFKGLCGNFNYNYNPTGSGDAYTRTNGSDKDSANALDLAFASREFKSSEPMADNLKGKMCIDAIVAVVNPSNSISKITAAQIKGIYDGTYTKWSQIVE